MRGDFSFALPALYGFALTLVYGLLLPGAAFDNTTLEARPAQVFRARVAFVFWK